MLAARLSQSPSHDLDISSGSRREGLFIPAARQILRVEFCPRGDMWADKSDTVISSAYQSSGTRQIAVCLAFVKRREL